MAPGRPITLRVLSLSLVCAFAALALEAPRAGAGGSGDSDRGREGRGDCERGDRSRDDDDGDRGGDRDRDRDCGRDDDRSRRGRDRCRERRCPRHHGVRCRHRGCRDHRDECGGGPDTPPPGGPCVIEDGEGSGYELSWAEVPLGAGEFVALRAPAAGAAAAAVGGRVLLLGGAVSASGAPPGTWSAASYFLDPVSGATENGPALREASARHAAAAVANGVVIAPEVIPGTGASSLLRPYVLHLSGGRLDLPPLHLDRVGHTLTVLPDGSYLVLGGDNFEQIGGDPASNAATTAEVLGPGEGAWRKVDLALLAGVGHDDFGFGVQGHTATLLGDGSVLVATTSDGRVYRFHPPGSAGGGANGLVDVQGPITYDAGGAPASVEALLDHAAFRLAPSGRHGEIVVLAGGWDLSLFLQPLTLLHDVAAGTWAEGPPLVELRADAAYASLPDGTPILLGGTGSDGFLRASVELLLERASGGEPLLDTDCDGVPDRDDICPAAYDPDQADCDGDGVGDACETDVTPPAITAPDSVRVEVRAERCGPLRGQIPEICASARDPAECWEGWRGRASLTQSPPPGTWRSPGTHTVVLRAVDAYGNAATREVSVEIVAAGSGRRGSGGVR
jgi:hypothetical protein